MNFYLAVAFNSTIILPGITALVLFPKIDKRYYPFVFCLWIGLINETVSLWLVLHHHQSLVNSNIYVFIESLLISWLFRTIRILHDHRKFILVIGLLALAWICENFIFSSIRVNSTYFRIFASMLIVGMSVQLVSRKVIDSIGNILLDSEFILGACFIIYFGFKALTQSFAIYGWTRSMDFLAKIYAIMLYINSGINLLYIPAVLWMRRKARFIFESS